MRTHQARLNKITLIVALAISSMDTERMPYRKNNSFCFLAYAHFYIYFHKRGQNYGNFNRNQSFRPVFFVPFTEIGATNIC